MADFALIEEQIRRGQTLRAKKALSGVSLRSLSLTDATKVASFFRRLGEPDKAARLLYGRIRRRTDLPEELVLEYCITLLGFQLTWEVQQRLSELSALKHPTVHFYLAGCHIVKWDYKSAKGHLEEFVQQEKDPYFAAVGWVNLIQCLIVEKEFAGAKKLVKKWRPQFQNLEWFRLCANLYELEAQISLAKGDLDGVLEQIGKSEEFSELQGTPDQIFSLKWKQIADAMKTGNLQGLIEFKQTLVEKEQWEGVRLIDWELVKMGADRHTADYLFYGTPHSAFRDRVVGHCGDISENFFMNGERRKVLEVTSGQLAGKKFLDGHLLALVQALTSDFYAPINQTLLYQQIYPHQAYCWDSSPRKVARLLSRLREKKPPFQIVSKSGGYRLKIHKQSCLLKTQGGSVDQTNEILNRLRSRFQRKDLERVLNVSSASAKRLLDSLQSEGRVARKGVGRSTFYEVLK